MTITICKIQEFEETLKNTRDYYKSVDLESCDLPSDYYDGYVDGLNKAWRMFTKAFFDELTEEL